MAIFLVIDKKNVKSSFYIKFIKLFQLIIALFMGMTYLA